MASQVPYGKRPCARRPCPVGYGVVNGQRVVYSTCSLDVANGNHNPVPDLDPLAVREQMERILLSPSFRNSKRHSSFLRYIVEEALNGRAAQLKERTVGSRFSGAPRSTTAIWTPSSGYPLVSCGRGSPSITTSLDETASSGLICHRDRTCRSFDLRLRCRRSPPSPLPFQHRRWLAGWRS